MTQSGVTKSLTLTETGGSGAQEYLGYKLTFDLTPYPVLGKETPRSSYRLNLTVAK